MQERKGQKDDNDCVHTESNISPISRRIFEEREKKRLLSSWRIALKWP